MRAAHYPLLDALSAKIEGVLEQDGLFETVEREGADGGRGGGVAAGVEREEAEDFTELRRDERPCAHVLRLVLAPDDALAGVMVGELGETVAVKRVELLDAHDGGVGELVLRAVVDEVVVNLARAEDQAPGGFLILDS